MFGIGRECGRLRRSPSWRRRSKTPASTRAAAEKGGVLISPWSQTSGFSDAAITLGMSLLTYPQVAASPALAADEALSAAAAAEHVSPCGRRRPQQGLAAEAQGVR